LAITIEPTRSKETTGIYEGKSGRRLRCIYTIENEEDYSVEDTRLSNMGIWVSCCEVDIPCLGVL
jgi:hypothetical protein